MIVRLGAKTMDFEEIVKGDAAHIIQTYDRFPVAFEYGQGCYLYDTTGKKYLDLLSAIATCSVGYGNEYVASAIAAQAKKLLNTTNLYYSELQVKLAQKLASLSGLEKCFFSNSGSESIETAIKLARKCTKKKKIIATKHAFHGRTCGSLSLTWKKAFKDFCKPLLYGVRYIEYGKADELKKAIDSDTAAFIVEPIQGEGGVIVPPEGYLREIREICNDNGILLICDEVQTNMRTGKWFAYQHDNIKPDIVAVAKGIANGVPIGVTISADGIDFEKKQHGSTFGGNALACAACLTTIEFVENNHLVEKATDKGEYLMAKLREMGVFNEVRGLGLMVGAVMKKKKAKDVVKKLLSDGVLLNATDERTLRFLPPLIVEKEQLDDGIAKLQVAFGDLND